jgi:DNA/RNA endonuclease G (NUC1)
MKRFLYILPLLILTILGAAQSSDVVRIKNEVFEVVYSQSLEQPLALKYRSTNRPTNVNRGSMDFYTEKGITTSDGADYLRNIYDKGHLAPAATFSDNQTNLKQTFSYLNCALQDQYLNRGEWRLLEEQERKWDDIEPLTIIINVHFDNPPKRVITNAAIPSRFHKHIHFEKSNSWKCYSFLNQKPTMGWEQHQIKCDQKEHKF